MSPKEKPKKLDAYVRVSQVRGREGESYITKKQQREAIERWCGLQGYEIARWHEEENRSGGDSSRPKWNEALRRALEGETDGVIVAKLDRFARSAIDGLKAVTELEKADKTFVSVAEKFDTADPYGRFTATVFFALAELELGRIKAGWADAKARARARGVHVGVARAGYRRNGNGELVEVPEQIEAVEQAFALRARGGASWQEVADVLTGAGVPTWHGRTVWTRQAAQGLIVNRAYRATEGPIPAWQWDKAQPRRDGKRSPRGEGYVLGQGLVRCGHCGMGLVRTVSHGSPMLRCGSPGGGHAAISYDKAADYIVSLAFSHVGPMLKSRAGGDGEALRQGVETAREEYNAALEMLGVETLPPESRQAHALEQAEAALAEFEAEEDAPLDFLTPVGVRHEFEKLPVAEQRRVLRQIVGKAVLKPGRGHVGERVVVEFQDGSQHPAEWSEAQVPALAQ
jgi:DNA invertase Pin-like site-specific DNA recombinase